MVAPTAEVDQARPPQHSPAVASLGRAVVVALVWTMLVVTAWLCIRRLSGRLQQPLGFPALLTVGVVSAAVVSALRYAGYRNGRWPALRRSLATSAMWLLPTLVLLLAAALSIRGTSAVALCALWGSLLLNELLWGRYGRHIQSGDSIALPGTARTSPVAVPTPGGLPAESLPRLPDGMDDAELPLPSDVSQQITRTQSRQAGDAMAGVLRALFQPGERSQNLHVAFCPPMPGRPTVEVIQLSGPRTRVKAADVQSFGVRFDLRLVAASQQQENVLIHFEARCNV
ncbi:MAG: hypothetical protein ACYC3X_16735 [Pirellulaceae bacterium]